MSPFEKIKRVYDTEPCARTFDQDLTLHMLNGFVFSTPDFFIMGRPVVKAASPTEIVDATHAFKREDCDCWHIFAFAGDTGKAWWTMPWPLPWFSFERKNELRIYAADRIKNLCTISE